MGMPRPYTDLVTSQSLEEARTTLADAHVALEGLRDKDAQLAQILANEALLLYEQKRPQEGLDAVERAIALAQAAGNRQSEALD